MIRDDDSWSILRTSAKRGGLISALQGSRPHNTNVTEEIKQVPKGIVLENCSVKFSLYDNLRIRLSNMPKIGKKTQLQLLLADYSSP